MATTLEVVNQALLLLGEGLVTQPQLDAPDDDASRTMVGMFDISRMAVLRDTKPGCARRYEELAPVDDVTAEAVADFAFAFELPSDLIRLISLFYGDRDTLLPGSGLPVLTRYRRVGALVGADELPVIAEYITDLPVEEFDSLTAEVLSAYIAWKAAWPLTASRAKQQAMLDLYAEMKRQSESADRSEGYRNQIRDDGILTQVRHSAR